MFENNDDKKFFLKELQNVQDKSSKRAEAFKAMVDHFFKTDADKEKETKRLASEQAQAAILGHNPNQAPATPRASLQRTGFGLHGEKNKTSLGNPGNPAGSFEMPGPDSHDLFSGPKESVTKKFGVSSRLGRFR